MKKTVIMMVTKDKYRLPIVVADSLEEMSAITGKSRKHISSYVSKWSAGKMDNSQFIKVELEE